MGKNLKYCISERFEHDPLCSYFDECQKNEIYLLNNKYTTDSVYVW